MTIMMQTPSDARALRDAFGLYPSGVTALCAMVDGEAIGMAASSFTSVSLEPPLVSVCIQNTSSTWQKLARAERIGVSVLGRGHEAACRSLAARTGDRFAGVEWSASETGAILIEGAAAHLECSIHASVEAGDHAIVLLRIEALATAPHVEPLVFHASKMRSLLPLAG